MSLPESTALRLRTQLDCLSTLLVGVTAEALTQQRVPGKWSARQNLAHLARYQEVFLSRLRGIQTELDPLLPRYRAEDDPEWPFWMDREVKDILQILSAQRTILVHEVQRMTSADLARTAIHPRLGRLTVVQWLEFFCCMKLITCWQFCSVRESRKGQESKVGLLIDHHPVIFQIACHLGATRKNAYFNHRFPPDRDEEICESKTTGRRQFTGNPTLQRQSKIQFPVCPHQWSTIIRLSRIGPLIPTPRIKSLFS